MRQTLTKQQIQISQDQHVVLINRLIDLLVFNIKKNDVVWCPMRLFTKDQMTKKLITIDHLTAFNNEQCPLSGQNCFFMSQF